MLNHFWDEFSSKIFNVETKLLNPLTNSFIISYSIWKKSIYRTLKELNWKCILVLADLFCFGFFYGVKIQSHFLVVWGELDRWYAVEISWVDSANLNSSEYKQALYGNWVRLNGKMKRHWTWLEARC